MKRHKLLLFVALVLFIAQLSALDISLYIQEVTAYSVSGTLLVSNPSSEDVILHFPSSGTFDLMVDGNVSDVVYLTILCDLLIPAGTTHSQIVQYVGIVPLSPGTHVAQARYVLPDNPPAGGPETFVYSSTPLSGINDLEYTFSVNSVGANGVSGTLQMHNPNYLPWMISFPNAIVARIFVDGEPPSELYPPMSINLQINPGETHSEEIHHSRNTPYAPGTHTAQACLFLQQNIPVGAATSFIIEPSQTETDVITIPQTFNVSVAPNPGSSFFRVSSDVKQLQTFSIFDIKGRKVFETTGTGEFTWDGKDHSNRICPAGVYFVKAKLESRYAIKGFVKY